MATEVLLRMFLEVPDVGAERRYCGTWVSFDTILHCCVLLQTAQGVRFRGCMLSALNVDVEEYFHPTEVQTAVDQNQLVGLPSRIEDQLHQILQLLDIRDRKSTRLN